jgi:hypothetical protein
MSGDEAIGSNVLGRRMTGTMAVDGRRLEHLLPVTLHYNVQLLSTIS